MADTNPSFPWLDVRIRRRWFEAHDIVALELESRHGTALPVFDAGAFIDVALADDTVRPYSLANAPHERDHYLLAVRLEPDGQGASRALHAMNEGAHLRVSPPRNAFPLAGGALHSVLLAGGIGVTPLLSMAAHLWRHAASFDFHYGFRAPERAAFLPRLRQAPYAHRVRLWCSQSFPYERLNAARALAQVPRLSHIYLCGPTRFMGEAADTAIRLGWPTERIHRESFHAAGTPVA